MKEQDKKEVMRTVGSFKLRPSDWEAFKRKVKAEGRKTSLSFKIRSLVLNYLHGEKK